MDESTFETFDEELGTPLKDVSPPKPLRQTRRPEMYSQRRVREEPPVVQQVPKSVPIETPISRGMSLRKALSMQNVTQIEPPWEGVTLNRCLFIAITILVLASGCQRLHEFLRGRKVGTDVDAALNMKHSALKKSHLLAPEMETSLWDTFFSWLSDDYDDDEDDEDDEEEGSRRDISRKATRGRATRGLRHKTIPDRKLLKNREGRQKGRRGKTRPDKDETKTKVKAQRETVKKPKEKKMEREREQETERKKIKESVKKAGLKIGKKDIKQKST
ncbi:uncharacterized protein LOC134302786 [Trichomycterus rosablanca]|uniref:uncharacterized protein LOC134302786 n=1 Tax=Trichomycterus rosablanca TaxID=2290929 RepID=UPI002F35B67A